MGIGAGLLTGVSSDSNPDLSPSGGAYLEHSGAVYHAQDESGSGSIAFYEVTDPSDSVSFSVEDAIEPMDEPVLTLYAVWGETDFDVQEYNSGDTIVSERSGFDADVWHVNVAGTSGQYTITNFDAGGGVDGTQAGWVPFVVVNDLQTY